MPPNAAIARRTIASGSPDRATTRSGVIAGVEAGRAWPAVCVEVGCEVIGAGVAADVAALLALDGTEVG